MPETRPRYAFGPLLPGASGGRYTLDPAERRLLRDGDPVALPPKAFDVLAALVAQPGHLVTKDALLEAVWPGVVVEENALAVAVSRLRAALGEDGRGLIASVSGHGYRFVGPVTLFDEAPPYAGDAQGTGGPRIEDVVPTLAPPGGDGAPGDGAQGDGSRAFPAPERDAPVGRAAPRAGTRRGLLVGAATLAGLALAAVIFTAVAGGGERPAVLPVAARTVAHDPPAEALLAYRRGRALWTSRRIEAMAPALYQFRLATALDSTFAPAYVGTAQVYAFTNSSVASVEAPLARALALDPTLAEA